MDVKRTMEALKYFEGVVLQPDEYVHEEAVIVLEAARHMVDVYGGGCSRWDDTDHPGEWCGGKVVDGMCGRHRETETVEAQHRQWIRAEDL